MQTSQERPRFRQDLVAEPIDEQGARFIDVIDPDSGSTYRFYEVEYSIACAMDGERDIAGLVQWAKEELGLTPSPTEVKSVIATLGDLGYLDPEGRTIEALVAGEPAQAAAEAASIDDHELGAGVIAAQASRTAATPGSVGDFELGTAGGGATEVHQAIDAGDFALGAPGRSTGTFEAEEANEEFALGAPGARGDEPVVATVAAAPAPAPAPAAASSSSVGLADVSLDLSEGLSIQPDDVKEAVRASRVMSAVELPADLVAQLEAPAAPAPPPRAEPTPPPRVEAAPPPRVEAAPPKPQPIPAKAEPIPAAPAVKAEPKAEPKTRTRSEKAPVELPKAPAPIKAEPEAKPSKGPSFALIALLIVVVIGAGVFTFLKFFLADEDEVPAPTTSATPTTGAATPAPGPSGAAAGSATGAGSAAGSGAGAAPVVKLVKEELPPVEVKPLVSGQLAELGPTDKPVKAGDVVARMVGYKPIAAEVAALQEDVDKRLPAEIAAAEKERDDAKAAGNKGAEAAADARVAERRKRLDGKQSALTAKQAELDKYVIKAVGEGTIVPVAKANSRVSADDVLVKLVRTATLTARFELPTGRSFSVDSSVQLVAKGKEGQKANCLVAAIEQGQLKIQCGNDSGLTEGAEVSLVIP
jgi:hypothetical protein